MEPEHDAALKPVGQADAVQLTEELRIATGEARQTVVVLAGRAPGAGASAARMRNRARPTFSSASRNGSGAGGYRNRGRRPDGAA